LVLARQRKARLQPQQILSKSYDQQTSYSSAIGKKDAAGGAGGLSNDLLISTDVAMAGDKVLQYYRLSTGLCERFQIEFLIRYAKIYAGLEQCQVRSQDKLYNHWNMALFSVSLARWQWWAKLLENQKQDTPFSMRTVKTACLNQYMAETIFSILGLDMSSNKVRKFFNKCINIGNIAA
jgi:hypothetical protein